MTSDTAGMRVIRAADRHHWRNSWLGSWQSFPATGNFDFAANAFGVLLVHNDDTIAPGEGLDAHEHSTVEIVTWVVDGTLVHRDSEGSTGMIPPGVAQRMSAGDRVVHSERNASSRLSDEWLRVVQMWIAPDTAGGPAQYDEKDFTAALDTGGLVTVVSGMRRDAASGAIGIGNSDAALHVARMRAGDEVTVPDAPYVHVYVTRGSVEVGSAGAPSDSEQSEDTLSEGDALRARSSGAQVIRAVEGAEILVWEMHAGVK